MRKALRLTAAYIMYHCALRRYAGEDWSSVHPRFCHILWVKCKRKCGLWPSSSDVLYLPPGGFFFS